MKVKKDIPFLTFESEMVRKERTIRRLWITIILLIVTLSTSNFVWMLMR